MSWYSNFSLILRQIQRPRNISNLQLAIISIGHCIDLRHIPYLYLVLWWILDNSRKFHLLIVFLGGRIGRLYSSFYLPSASNIRGTIHKFHLFPISHSLHSHLQRILYDPWLCGYIWDKFRMCHPPTAFPSSSTHRDRIPYHQLGPLSIRYNLSTSHRWIAFALAHSSQSHTVLDQAS